MERLEDWNDITFDEAIKEIKSLRQSLGGAVQNAECREEKKDKEIERLIEIIKNRERQIFDLYIKIFPRDAWVDAEQALMRIYEEGTSP